MKTKKWIPNHYAIILFVSLGLFLAGCSKKLDTIVVIHVRDAANTAVVEAQVTLSASGSVPGKEPIAFDTALTNSNGMALFNLNELYQLGQAGVAVLDVKVSKDGAQTEGIVKVEEERTTSKTIFLDL